MKCCRLVVAVRARAMIIMDNIIVIFDGGGENYWLLMLQREIMKSIEIRFVCTYSTVRIVMCADKKKIKKKYTASGGVDLRDGDGEGSRGA